MHSKHLFLVLSVLAIIIISGCTQAGKQKSEANKDCASESVEVLDADGSKTPGAGLDDKDKIECYVQFSESDNVYVVFSGSTAKSIYMDVNNDQTYSSDDEDINILDAKDGDEGENAASILNLYYNDHDVNPGKYDPKIPKGVKSKYTVGGEDIGIGKGPAAKCGDGILQAPEQCDPPGGQCSSGSICEAGKCACTSVSQSGTQNSAGSGSSQSAASSGSSSQPTTKSSSAPSSVSSKKITFSISSTATTDTQLGSVKLLLPSKKSITCSPETFSIKKGSTNSFELSMTSTGETSLDKVSQTYTLDKASASAKVGEAALTAGSSESTVSEVKLYSTTEKKSISCKPSSSDLKIPAGETSIIQLTGTVTASGNASNVTGLQEPKASATPTVSGSPLVSASKTPTTSTSATAISSPAPTASATPTPTASSSASPTCPSNTAFTSGSLPCKCGSTTYTSSNAPSAPSLYCCDGNNALTVTPCYTPACPNNAQSSQPCTCGSQTIPAGTYCCNGVPGTGAGCATPTPTPSSGCPGDGACNMGYYLGCISQSTCTSCGFQWCQGISGSSCQTSCTSP